MTGTGKEQVIKLPTLYKRTKSGKIQGWKIIVKGARMITAYGLLGGELQKTEDKIRAGKNTGRKNATTKYEQAAAEAQARWTKKKDIEGYVESKEAAKTDTSFKPMLALPFDKHGKDMAFPCYLSVKLDGMRCVAQIEDGICYLRTRNGKTIESVPHINRRLEKIFPKGSYLLDGELYRHGVAFEDIMSICKRQVSNLHKESVSMQYHIFDYVSEENTAARTAKMQRWSKMSLGVEIRIVDQKICREEEDIFSFHAAAIRQGFEGTMLKAGDQPYVQARSKHLLKLKDFEDAEFEILDVKEGRGKLAGCAIFVCKTESGKEFESKMTGATSFLKKCFEDYSLWEGKLATIQYQNLSKKGIPRFGNVIAIIDKGDK